MIIFKCKNFNCSCIYYSLIIDTFTIKINFLYYCRYINLHSNKHSE